MSVNSDNPKQGITSCICPPKTAKDETNYRDLFIDKIIDYLSKLKEIYSKLIGTLFSLLGSMVVFVLLQIANKVEFFDALWYKNLINIIRASIPTEMIIIAGFFFASISGIVSKWVEIALLILIGSVSAYWSFTNSEWIALAASIYMIVYGVVRTKLLNNLIDDYVLSFFKHSMIVIITLLSVNFILKLTNK